MPFGVNLVMLLGVVSGAPQSREHGTAFRLNTREVRRSRHTTVTDEQTHIVVADGDLEAVAKGLEAGVQVVVEGRLHYVKNAPAQVLAKSIQEVSEAEDGSTYQ